MSQDSQTIADGGQTPPSGRGRPDSEDRVVPGTLVGRYLAIDELGRGGMGVVIRAYDPRLQREVALKLLRTRAMSERARARMIREARAMAKLSHRNVVAVFDVDIEPQSVVLAMELIDGATLRTWASAERGWPEVVDVLIEAGRGLAAAHRAGLLHRDFKPGNVLVDARGSGVPRVCVTDFGLARASQGSLSGPATASGAEAALDDTELEQTLTVAGTVVGTPAYMAPEQHAGQELSAAADQYAFCLASWEALCGARPFSERAPRALLKAKRAGPPKWPTGLSVPSAVVDALTRGLAPSPDDRWPSMDALLDRLARTRAPGSRRRLGPLVALGVVAAGSAVALGSSAAPEAPCTGAEAALSATWGPAAAQRTHEGIVRSGAPLATSVWERVGPALDDYAAAWKQMHTEACEATAVFRAQSESVLDLRMGCLARAEVELAAASQRLATADADVLANAHALVDGLPALSRCADIEALTAAVPPPPPEVAQDVARLRSAIAAARADHTAGKVRESVAALEAIDAEVVATQHAPLHAEWSTALGPALGAASRPREAEPVLRRALRETLATGQWDAVARSATALTGVLRELARPEEGLVVAETAWGVVARTSKPVLFEAALRAELGSILRHQAHYEAAQAELDAVVALRAEALGPGHVLVAQARMHLGNVLRDRGHDDKAEAEYVAAMELLADAVGPRHPAVAAAHVSFGSFLARNTRFDEAREHTDLAIEIATESLGPDSHRLGSAYANRGGLLARQGKLEEAAAAQRKAIAIWEAELGPAHADVVMERGNNLAQTLMSLRRFDEAEALVRPALEAMTATFGARHPRVAMLQMCLAGILDGTERSEQAEPLVRAALGSRLRALGPAHRLVAHTRINLGAILIHQDRLAEAEPVLRAGLDALVAAVGEGHPTVAMARSNLAFLLLDLNRAAEAEPLLAAALSGFTASVGPEHPSTQRVQARLDTLRAGRR